MLFRSYKMVWYWGNGSKVVQGPDGKDHMFGFEITWGIGDESNATETAIFWDGKAHKFGPVDVEVFPKPDKFEEPWHFVSQDGRFDFTMTPFTTITAISTFSIFCACIATKSTASGTAPQSSMTAQRLR